MKKRIVEDCCILSISDLKRWGWLPALDSNPIRAGGRITWRNKETGTVRQSFGLRLETFNTTSAGEAGVMSLDYVSCVGAEHSWNIRLTTTPCNYGGIRYWFICPCWRGGSNGKFCNRRVRKLYLPPSACEFGCRHCHNLSYASRNVSRPDRDGYVFMSKLMRLTFGKDWINNPKVQDILNRGKR